MQNIQTKVSFKESVWTIQPLTKKKTGVKTQHHLLILPSLNIFPSPSLSVALPMEVPEIVPLTEDPRQWLQNWKKLAPKLEEKVGVEKTPTNIHQWASCPSCIQSVEYLNK